MFVFEAISYRQVRITREFKAKRQLVSLAMEKLVREERQEQRQGGKEESTLDTKTKRRRRNVRSSAA